MALFAISDLHLSLSGEKPMDVFSSQWKDHHLKIRDNWNRLVTEDDTVLIGGDISWAMNMEDVMIDLDFISDLPGEKILIKGNHDYWWGSIKKLNTLYSNMHFIQNNYFTYKDFAICGTRGWVIPGSITFKEDDNKIYNRELIRLRLSLDAAKKDKYEKFIAMIHYPPVNESFKDSGFTDIFEEYSVSKVIYGHLHDKSLKRVMTGMRNNIEYILTSVDYIDFCPVKIMD